MIFGGVDGSTFGCFLLKLLKQYPEILKPEEKYVLVLDNAPIHRSRILRQHTC